MVTNAQSDVVLNIRENWLSTSLVRQDAALLAWAALVGTDVTLDFKKDIAGKRWFDKGVHDVALGDHFLNYDAVANMHYGFVGRSAGFGESFLVRAAGLAQLQSFLGTMLPNDLGNCNATSFCDHPFATWSIRFGSYLYDLYGGNLEDLNGNTLSAALANFKIEYGEPPDPPPGALAP